jgi:hypothetical protein
MASILENFIALLKLNGFEIYSSAKKENLTYFYFIKNGNIGYCQEDLAGVSLSTVHKPSCTYGTGRRLYLMNNTPTIEQAVSCFAINETDAQKYSSFDEFKKQYPMLRYYQLI